MRDGGARFDFPMSAGLRRALDPTYTGIFPRRKDAHNMPYDNTNSGFMARNDKGDNPSRPDFTGKLDIDGTGERRIVAWTKTSKKGNKYLSLAIDAAPEPDAPQSEMDL